VSAAAAAREPALERRPPAWQWLACLAAFAALLVRSAWLCDDAYITLRTAENLVAGAGPRWNVAERVQAYTHPLWMLLLALGRALSGEAYRSSLALSFALSLAGFALLLGGARGRAGAWVAAAALLGSKAFVDYSTSGLEGPLAHALGAALVLASAAPSGARSAAALALCASGLWLTRPDLVPLFGPLAAAGILARRRHRAALAAGFLPAAAWSGFALLYYGFLLPNTAPAKLGSGLPRAWLAEQGLCYLLDSLRRDR
jgi:arabinofuranosyltransferase